jgi:hypothetical protein
MPARKRSERLRRAILISQAVAALTITQSALRFVRLHTARRWLLRVFQFGSRPRREIGIDDLSRAIESAKRRCPVSTTCLGEALVAEALFKRNGYEPVLCFGAGRSEGRFEAHAWLEQDHVVVVGGPQSVVARYTRFPEIGHLIR